MFSVDELGLIAYLNDNALPALNRELMDSSSDVVLRALDQYLSRSSGDGSAPEDLLVRMLNERMIGREALTRTTDNVRHYLDRGFNVITFWDASYPGNLRATQDPPLVLYADGKLLPGTDQVAILGTTTPSEKGLDLAYELGARMTKKGRTVISGLTRGIDAQALEGALSAGGAPVAMSGTPLPDSYPEECKELACEVARCGAVVSELTEEAYLHPGRSLCRDQVIGGMSGSVVIVESSGVGAMARLVERTLKLGRKAYVIDQVDFENPDHEAGFKKLKGLGAVPITHADEIASQETRQGKLF